MKLEKSKIGTLPPCIIVDVDGTLAIPHPDRHPADATAADRDTVNHMVQETVFLYQERYAIVIVSGRPDKHKEITERWLARHHIKYREIWMRPTEDMRPDFVIKREIYETKIKPRWRPLLVLDDRNSVVALWRSLNIPCFQVADGDKTAQDRLISRRLVRDLLTSVQKSAIRIDPFSTQPCWCRKQRKSTELEHDAVCLRVQKAEAEIFNVLDNKEMILLAEDQRV